MNPQEITEFFRKHGCTRTFRIAELPVFHFFYLEENPKDLSKVNVLVKNVEVIEYDGNIDDFIKEHMKESYSDIYIYQHQDFSKNMKCIRFHKEIPQKLINRMLKINKLNDRIKQNIQ